MKMTEIEAAVLGAALLERDVIHRLSGSFGAELFTDEKNIAIAEVVMKMYAESKPIDILTVTQRLRKDGQLDNAGGAYYIATLTNAVASTANVEFHCRLLQQEALRRHIVATASKGLTNANDDRQDPFDVMSQMQVALDDGLKSVVKFEIKKVNKIHEKLIDESLKIAKSGIKSGVPTGLRALDALTNGWQKSDLIILAGRPGMGKTSLAIKFLTSPAYDLSIPTAMFSLEMSAEQLVGRMQSVLSKMDSSRVIKKQLSETNVLELAQKARILESAPLYIDDTPSISIMEFKGKCRKLVREDGVKLIVIDYIQLMRSGSNHKMRENEISEISRSLKATAKELDVPIIALSQLSRAVETRGGNKRPILSDLRESGQIEQDADMVIFAYRPEYYDIPTVEIRGSEVSSHGIMILDVAKHRNGSLEDVICRFEAQFTNLSNYDDEKFANYNQSDTFVQSPLMANYGFDKQAPF